MMQTINQTLTQAYSPGDWIVHTNLGIGQVTAIENKTIGNEKTTYYRIEADQMMVWVPIDEPECLRAVASPAAFAEATAVLQRPSQRMSTAFQIRLARIRKAEANGTPQALARIVRDLWARRRRRGQLSNTEDQAMRKMIDTLLSEWAVSLNMDEHQAKNQFYSLLQQHA